MGGIYSTNDKTTSNIRQNNGNSLINFSAENSQINNGAYTSAFHPSSMGSVNRSTQNDINNTLNGAFVRNLNTNLSGSHGSFNLQGQRNREKGNDDLLNYRYMADGNPFQPRNLSISPNSMLSNQFKHHTYTHNQPHLLLNNSLQQSRQNSVLNVTKNDSLQNNQLHQSCSKLSSEVSSRVNSTNHLIGAQNINQPGMFQATKRLQLLSQPPNKRPRLSHDFTNISHQNPNSISQSSHFLNLNHSDNKKMSSSPQKHIQNISVYKGNVSSNGAWQNKEPSYYPQVEAISPVPDDMRHCDLSSVTEKDNIGEKLRDIEDEIIKQQEHVNRLKEKTDLLNNKINQPNIDSYSKEEDSCIPLSRDPIQLIIANNQRKATDQHLLFQKFCGEHVSCNPLSLPLYKQPSDIELLINVKTHFHKTFKPILTKYIRRRKLAERARLKYLAENYEVLAKAWYKRLEKSENSVKRRQKELKYREQFEKVFPEIKRNREEKEKDTIELAEGINFNYDTSVNVNNSFANTRSVSHNCNGLSMSEQQRSHTPYDSVKENEKMKEYAIDPPVILPNWNKNFGLKECTRLIGDPKHKHLNFQNFKNNWSREEVEIFKEQYINTPKNFGRIASCLPKKTVSDCIQYYYLTKKAVNYKALIKKNARRRRVQAERQRQYRGEAEHHHNNNGSIHQSTSDTIMDSSSNSIESNKIEHILHHNNFSEIDNISKEQHRSDNNQRNIYIPEISNSQSVNKTPAHSEQDKKNTIQDQPTKSNKDTNVGCSDRNTVIRHSRDSDSDENDEVHRNNVQSECIVNTSNSSQFNKIPINESDYKSEKEKQSDKCSDTYFTNTTKQSSQTNFKFDSKTNSNQSCKPEYIHIKDAIDYSIEQNLAQCLDNKREANKCQRNNDQISFLNDQFCDKQNLKIFENHSIFQNINIDDSTIKNSALLESISENYKNIYSSQISRENSAFQEVKKDLNIKNIDKSLQLNSTFNRKILMKDFCTAQMINHGPINSIINSKSNTIPFQKNPSTSNFIDPYINDNLNKTTNVLTKTSDFFIDRVSKLYEEEVEPYTDEFRNRSDSQRTRTSSEASQMYAYIKDRSLKNEHRSKTSISSKSYNDDKNFMTDSRLKMPPPEVTDQKVFRSQKSSFCSKKNPFSKSLIPKDCDIIESDSLKNKVIIDDSNDEDIEESTEKRKVVTAANILNSITDKNAHCNNDVKLIAQTNKICDMFKSNEQQTCEIAHQKNHFMKNSPMSLDGHIKQLIVEDYDCNKNISTHLNYNTSNFTLENKSEYSKRNYSVPLKKRDKPSLSDDRTKLEMFNKSPIMSNNIKRTRNLHDSSESFSKFYLEKNNNIVFKEKLEVDTDENYDSESPRFNSPGKLLIDLGNNSEGN